MQGGLCSVDPVEESFCQLMYRVMPVTHLHSSKSGLARRQCVWLTNGMYLAGSWVLCH